MVEIKPFQFNLIGARHLYDKELPPIEYLINKFIIKAGLTYLVGPPASFKTGLALLTAICGICRKKLLCFGIKKPFRTMFIDEENGIRNTKDRFVKLLKGFNVDITKEIKDDDIIFANISNFLLIPPHVDELKRKIEKYKPDLVVIDNIARCMVGSERDEQDVSRILRLLKPLIEEFGVSFLIIHHTRKGDAKNLDDISGSRDFGGQCDNAFLLKQFKRSGKTKEFVLSQVKAKYGLEIDGIDFSVTGGNDRLNVEFTGLAVENIEKARNVRFYRAQAWVTKWIHDSGCPQEFQLTALIEEAKESGFSSDDIRNVVYRDQKKSLLSLNRCQNSKKRGWYGVIYDG